MASNLNKKKLEFPDMFARIVLEKKLMPECDLVFYCKIIRMFSSPDLEKQYSVILSYDVYFPTLQLKVEGRTCQLCKKYHSSKKSLNRHLRFVSLTFWHSASRVFCL